MYTMLVVVLAAEVGGKVERGNCAVPHRIGEGSRRGGAVDSPKAGSRQHGCDVGALSRRARLPEPSQCRCWIGVRSSGTGEEVHEVLREARFS